MKRYCRSHNIKLYEPISLLSNQSLNKLLYGDSLSAYKGVIPVIKQLNRNSLSERRKRELSKYIRKKVCPQCLGKRLNHLSLNVKINGYSIFDLTDVSIDKLKNFLTKFKFSKKELKIVRNIIKEINNRLNFLIDVGLNYLTLNRLSSTLSGGEAQRIRLATQIGSELRGVMYILDEPSIGLHQRDNYRLIKTLKKLRDLKNTVIVVEHDKQIMNEADYIVDIGPKAGRNGGDLVVSGTPSVVKNCSKSITGQYLLGIKNIKPKNKTRIARDFLEIVGAKENNLKNINVKFPLGVLCCVTGVSGSGKSSLVNEILYKGLKTEIHASTQIPGKYKKIINISKIDKVICIDQSPIGRTPRSNPATYIKVFDYIRNLFSKTKEARVRGYKPGRFSFNVPNGRCEHCRGDGILKIEMHFLPDIYVTCEKCKGKRYSKETLEVTYKGRNIAEILNMTVEEALKFFKNVPAIYKKLHMLNDVGLGYIKLGQSATTLSGGEAQRVKLTLELAKRDTGKTLYILDEPTTGLHFDDVKKLLDVLDKLVSKGNSVIIIEHNLDVIKTADYIIDLGPLGGTKGGYIVAKGAPRVVAQNKDSHTGVFLKTIFKD
jgi:excinuclease ABC subunit A